MATAHDVTAYILERRRVMAPVRLQKLLYYGQAWHLATMGKPLFNEEIFAFAYGPVVYDVWDRHRYATTLKAQDATGDADALTDLEREVVDAVLDAYKKHLPFELADLSHSEAPWADAWTERSGNRKISHEAMRAYYAHELVKAPSERTTPQIPHIPDAQITYFGIDEYRKLVETLDEPDSAEGLVAALRRNKK